MKQLALLRRRAIGDCREESAINLVESPGETVDREIAGKHAAFDAEDRNGAADDFAVGRDRPRLSDATEAGNLDGDIGLPCAGAWRASPLAKPKPSPINQQKLRESTWQEFYWSKTMK